MEDIANSCRDGYGLGAGKAAPFLKASSEGALHHHLW